MFNGIEIGGCDPSMAPCGTGVTSQPQSTVEAIPFEHRLLTKKEISQYFGVTERTIEVWMRRRYIPYLRIGQTVRFRVAMVLRYVNDKYLVPAGQSPRHSPKRMSPSRRDHGKSGHNQAGNDVPFEAVDSGGAGAAPGN